MELFRVHAFSVNPARTLDHEEQPVGGRIKITKTISDTIFRIISEAKFPQRARVDFNVDSTSRTNDVRDAIIEYAFGNDANADKTASSLAVMLSTAMDLRSKPNLFIITAFREQDIRYVYLWMFPRDEAFRFTSTKGALALQVLTDIFSQTSNLRKAAYFNGRKIRTDFMVGRILDFQSGYEDLKIADFWRIRFLKCRFGLVGDAGSRLLSDALREATEASITNREKEQLFATILAISHTPKKRWTLQEIADTYLEGPTKLAFLEAIPNETTRVSTFELNKSILEKTLKFRIFRLNSGVFVSSPIDEVGKSVRVDDEKQDYLHCEGEIVEQKVRTKHA